MKYRVHWVNTDNGREGTGAKEFEKEEAEDLCAGLNASHPNIEHTVVPSDGIQPAPQKEEPRRPQPLFTPLTDSSPMPFGTHKGRPMISVPSDYLDFISGNAELMAAWPGLADYIERSKKSIRQDLEREDR